MNHGPAPLQLLTRAGCHLCEEARGIVAELAQRYAVAWAEVDITTDAALAATYADRVPVTLLDGVEQGCWWVDEAQLARALAHRAHRAGEGGPAGGGPAGGGPAGGGLAGGWRHRWGAFVKRCTNFYTPA